MRTDQQIVDETNDLARYILSNLIGTGYEAPQGHRFYDAADPRSEKAWTHAVAIMEMTTHTDANDALANLDPEQIVAPEKSERDQMIDLLSRSLDAWEDEEESVKEEHADLITDLNALIDKIRPTKS